MRTLWALACVVALAAWPVSAGSQDSSCEGRRPPLVVDAGRSASGDEGSTVRFLGAAEGGVEPYEIEWTFGDGEAAAGSLGTEHLYDDNDEYEVTLEVTDALGETAIDTTTAHVRNVPPTVTITIGTTRPQLGEVFIARPSITDPSHADTLAGFDCWDDVDNGAGWRAWPRRRGDSYAEPRTRTIQFVAQDKDGGQGWTQIEVEAEGAASRWGDLPPPRDVVPAGGFEAHAMRWIANSFGMEAVPGRQGEITYFVSNDCAHGVVTRLSGSTTDPFASYDDRGGRADRPIGGNPYVHPNVDSYLMAGPTYRVDERTLLMLALSGWASQFGGPASYGSVDIVFSRDDGQSWEYVGPILKQPVTYEAWAEASHAYGDYASQGTSYVVARDPDGDGVDYFYCYFSQVEGEVLGRDGDFHRNFIPCGVARAPIDDVVRAVEYRSATQVDDQGRLVFDLDGNPIDLWWKWHGDGAHGEWNSPGLGGRATSVTRVGGARANQVAWNTALDLYVMVAEPADAASNRLYFLTSDDGLRWSLPEPMLAKEDPSSVLGCPTILAPEGTTGASLEAPFVYRERGQVFPLRR